MEILPGQGTAAKAYAGALVAVIMYVVNSLITGEWADVESIAPALTIILVPAVVWFVKNKTTIDVLAQPEPFVSPAPPMPPEPPEFA